MKKTILFLALVATGCASTPDTPAPRQAAVKAPVNVLSTIRDEAVKYRAEFQVELIRDAHVVEAIEASKQAEMRGDRAAAEGERLAREAWEASAKTGEWCARSWLTVAEAREIQQAPNGARQARERAAECMPPRVDRF